MNDGTPSRHRADLPLAALNASVAASGTRRAHSGGEGAHVCLGPPGPMVPFSARGRGPQLQNSRLECAAVPPLTKITGNMSA
jgi:hypothetical protein